MKRMFVVLALLTVGLSVGLWLKVRANHTEQLRPSGGSGVIEGTEVVLTARISARIISLAVREGDRVEKEQVLVELDCRENRALLAAAQARRQAAQSNAGAAQAQVEAALGSARAAVANIRATGAQSAALQANRAASNRQQQRIQRLQGEGGATASDLDAVSTQVLQLGEQVEALRAQQAAARGQAAAARAAAEATRRQAEATLAAVTASQAEVERARTLVEECQLRTPVSGVVQTRAYEPGEAVLPGSHILTVVHLEEAKVTFYLSNRELSMAAAGKPVTVVADTYPGETFTGRIEAVGAQAEFTSRSVQTREDRDRLVFPVHVRLSNRERKLRPGMPVEVTIDGTGGGGR